MGQIKNIKLHIVTDIKLNKMMDPGERITSKNTFVSKEHKADILGNPTHIIAQKYSNRLFVVITQCSSFGTLFNISKEEVDTLQPDNADVPFSIQVLIGVEDDMYKVCQESCSNDIQRQ